MSRRRYLSTSISTDPRVAKLATLAGLAGPLLYTWLIPHAADDATLPADPDELLSLVVPALAIKGVISLGDVQQAIDAMVGLGLLERDGPDDLRFPASFFKYQTYVKGERRGTPQPEPPAAPPPTEDDERRTPAQNTADQRESAQNVASLKSSSSFTSPVSSTPSVANATSPPVGESAPAPSEGRRTIKRTNYEPPPGAPDAVDRVYEHFRAKIQPHSRLVPRKKIAARLQRFSEADLIVGIDHFASRPWWMEHNASRGAAWFFENDERSEQFLLMGPEPEKKAVAPRELRVVQREETYDERELRLYLEDQAKRRAG